MAVYTSANALGQLTVQVSEGRNFEKKSFICILKLHKIIKQTPPSAKSNTPKWNTSYDFMIFEEDNQLQVQVFYSKKKFCIGEVVIALEPLKSLEVTMINQWLKLKGTSHVEQGGEIRLILRYCPLRKRKATTNVPLPMGQGITGDSTTTGADAIASSALLLHQLRRGPQTWYERMEQAVLEERDFLSNELTRIVRTYGSESVKATTVRDMLTTLERSARELKLDLAQQAQPNSEAEAQRMRPELAAAIEDLESNSVRRKREALILLTSYLKIEEDAILFSRCGGTKALISILSSPHQALVHKALEHLNYLSFDDRARSGFDCTETAIELQPFLIHKNDKLRALAACVFTNLILDPNPRVQQYVSRGSGLETLLGLLDEKQDNILNCYIPLRGLWALSNIHLSINGGKREMIEGILCRIGRLLSHENTDVREKSALVLSNMAALEDNLSLLHSHQSSWLPALTTQLKHSFSQAGATNGTSPVSQSTTSGSPSVPHSQSNVLLSQPHEVVLQTLRALTNVAIDQEMRTEICGDATTIECLVKLVRIGLQNAKPSGLKRKVEKDDLSHDIAGIRRQAAWAIGNLAVGLENIRALSAVGAWDALLALLVSSYQNIVDANAPQTIEEDTRLGLARRKNSLHAALALGVAMGIEGNSGSSVKSTASSSSSNVLHAGESTNITIGEIVQDDQATLICTLRAINNMSFDAKSCLNCFVTPMSTQGQERSVEGFSAIVSLINSNVKLFSLECIGNIASSSGKPAQQKLCDCDAAVKIISVMNELKLEETKGGGIEAGAPGLINDEIYLRTGSTQANPIMALGTSRSNLTSLGNVSKPADAQVASMACLAMGRFIDGNLDNQRVVVAAGGIKAVTKLIEKGMKASAIWLKSALYAVSCFSVEDNVVRDELISSGLLPILVALLRSQDDTIKTTARFAVAKVAATERTKEILIRALLHQHGAVTK